MIARGDRVPVALAGQQAHRATRSGRCGRPNGVAPCRPDALDRRRTAPRKGSRAASTTRSSGSTTTASSTRFRTSSRAEAGPASGSRTSPATSPRCGPTGPTLRRSETNDPEPRLPLNFAVSGQGVRELSRFPVQRRILATRISSRRPDLQVGREVRRKPLPGPVAPGRSPTCRR